LTRHSGPAAADPSKSASRPTDDRSAVEQILAQQAAVVAIGQRALGEQEPQSLLNEAVQLVARTLGTELVSVMELAPDGDSLTMVAGTGWRDNVVGKLKLGAETGSMSGYTLATGGPVIVEDLRTETRFTVSSAQLEHRAVSGMSVRIGDAEDPYGALGVFTGRPGHFTSDDANFLQAVANVLAGAIARLRAERSLRQSRDQLATIVGGVTDGIIVQGRAGRLVFANDAAAQLTGYATARELLAEPMTEIFNRFEVFDVTGRPLTIEELPGRRAMSGEAVPETVVRFRHRATGEERWSVIQAAPVRGDDGTVLQAINVFRDVTAHTRAQMARHFLTDALAAMTSTLDVTEAARRLARACTPMLADCCLVDLLETDGSLQGAAVSHADPALAGLAQLQRDRLVLTVSDEDGPGRAVRDGTPRRGAAADVLVGQEEAGLQLEHYLSVPLFSHGRATGALTMLRSGAGRGFTEDEVELTQELGARAGPAMENARLYEAVDERRAELDAVLTAMAEAVLVFDPRGRLRLSNAAATKVFGRTVPQTRDELVARLRPADDPGHPPALDELSDIGADVQLEGSGRWLELRHYRVGRPRASHSSKNATSLVVLRDVTDARARRAARDAFMGLLSHELRTPITTIYGGSQLLERAMDEDQRMEVVHDIRAEAERLARLVEDLLVMTRVERGGVEIGDEPLLVQRLLPPLVEAMKARWSGLEVELDLGESLPAVRGDATYLEQVVRNLMTNAIRYGNAIETGLSIAVREGDDEVTVQVLDSGPGFDEAEPERLFELFYRAASARGVPGGAGIGLFVCRHLVQAMGGRIWARPREGGGSEFAFALPVVEADIG
jgi:PAS domain S-box-containing protein